MDNSWIGNYVFSRSRIDNQKEVIIDIDEDKGYTYAELNERANRLANYLKTQFGIVKGDRIAFISRNRVELIDGYFATGKLGAIFIPYNARLSSDELKQLIISETPKVVFYEDIFSENVQGLKDESLVDYFVTLTNSNNETEDLEYDILLKTSIDAEVSCPNLDLEDIHLIIHTGGTTGLPKGGMLSHRCELFNAFNEICTWGIHHEERTLLLLPLFHTGGWNLMLLPFLHAGATVFINRQFDPLTTLNLVEKEKLTSLFGAATIFRMIAEEPNFETTDFSSLKWAMAGAAPTPINIMQLYWNKGIKFVLGYGMTEAGSNNLSSPPLFLDQSIIEAKYASVGKPMYLSMIKLIDENGEEVTNPGEEGELIWSGPQVFSGYWDNEEETRKTLIDGWVYTGDIAMFDEDGFYYIVGRKKNMYISGGENVFPPEIESVLYEIEAIRECCVIGVSDERWGEVGKAIISLKEGMEITKEEILDALKSRLAKYKIPKYITVVDDVPKNSVGKIVVSEVMKIYGEASD